MSLRSTVAALLFGSALGCNAVQAPQLIELDSVAPLEVEVGSSLTLTGAGFPAGRNAHVRFVGNVYRPGVATESNVEIEASGLAPENHHLNVNIDERLAERFCGVGPEAVHATFRGSVIASFSPLAAGTPPVTAALGNVTLDVQPPSHSAARMRERIESAKKLLSYWGIEGEPMGSGGVEIRSLREGSLASRVLTKGDVLVAIDGVRIASVSDIATPRDVAKVLVRRGAFEIERELPVEEFDQRPFRRHGAALACLAALVLATLTFLSFNAARSGRGRAPVFGAADTPVVALSASALAIVPLLDNAWNQHIDVTTAVGWFVALTLAHGYAMRRVSLVATFFGTLLATLPIIIAFVATSATTGTWRLEELVRAQAGSPIDWFAFRGPATTALCACATFALARARLTPAVRLHYAAMIVIVFFGGWLSPVGSSAQHPSTLLLVAGMVTFLAKSAALAWATAQPMPVLTRVGNRMRGTAYTLAALVLCPLTWHSQAPLFVRVFLASTSLLMVFSMWAARRIPQRTIRANALL